MTGRLPFAAARRPLRPWTPCRGFLPLVPRRPIHGSAAAATAATTTGTAAMSRAMKATGAALGLGAALAVGFHLGYTPMASAPGTVYADAMPARSAYAVTNETVTEPDSGIHVPLSIHCAAPPVTAAAESPEDARASASSAPAPSGSAAPSWWQRWTGSADSTSAAAAAVTKADAATHGDFTRLLGTGVRRVTLFRVQVYAAALYTDAPTYARLTAQFRRVLQSTQQPPQPLTTVPGADAGHPLHTATREGNLALWI
ncbi:hypothetical protein CXG81DRAFT_21525, partial [Caulochytrium protostelioides]